MHDRPGSMTYATILFAHDGPVARLTLNRPARLNSLTNGMHAEIRDALTRLQATDARVLVITGAGRAFCAGQDLHERVAPPGETLDLGHVLRQSIEENYAPLVRRLRALPIPVVAAVNGTAAGAGANLAFACDIVIAAKSARFLQPFCRIGLIPDTGGTHVLPRVFGTARAMGIALLSHDLTAEQAAAWGGIWACVEDSDLAAAVDSMTETLVASPALALARAKHAIYASSHNTLHAQLDLERDALSELGRTAEYQESIRKLVSKGQ